MSDTSARLALPYLAPAQAQKHVTLNEALARLDILVQLTVEAFGAQTPPALPQDGEIHALGSGATGDWAGQDGRLAARQDGGWLFLAPQEGWQAVARDSGQLRLFRAGAWVLPQAAAPDLDGLAGVGVNAASDPVNRLAVAAPATLLSHEGAGHQLKLNKAAPGDTAALLFQTGFSGRAELGLAGGDDLSLKVSADGAAWSTALTASAATGHVGIGHPAPARPLHVGQALRLEPGTAPAAPAAGDLYFDAGAGKLRCHDGTAWQDLF